MTQNNKPEWFEITDKDEKPELRKVSKTLPVSAVLVVALILGAGAVVGQTQNETPASATNATESQTPQAVANPTTAAAVVVVGAVAATKLANPSIAQLPTGGDDDEDEDDDHRGRGHEDDDDEDEDKDKGDDD
ncbi:MAG: hypothetical protein RLZ78_40 [Actinomycetota bacterium]|jgi:uncharacterized protein HemX